MEIVIERGRTRAFEDLPDWSIALDGYVQGPALDNARHRYSFDHHKGCIRLITKASCEQVRDSVLLGLNPDRYTVFLNDVDTDTALSVWALRNPPLLHDARVAELITAAGLLDAHGGAYPLPKLRANLEWIGEPEVTARMEGRYEALSTEGLRALLEEICERMDRYARDDMPTLEELRHAMHEPAYRVLYEGTGWSLVETTDPHALVHLYRSGRERLVSVRPQADGSFAYTVAKKSDFVERFDVPQILAELSKVEPGWGGGSTIGGAPRNADGTRSKLTPAQVFEIVERTVKSSRD